VYPGPVGSTAGALRRFPGGDLVEAGCADLARGAETAESLLVASFATRLRRLGLDVPAHAIAEPEHRLYRLLAAREPEAAHGRYNALIRRLVSFARALECAS
jgi:hypothetical protein